MWIVIGVVAVAVIVLVLVVSRRHNNFSLIAHNIAYAHQYLTNQFREEARDDLHDLVLAGFVCSLPYFARDSFRPVDVYDAALVTSYKSFGVELTHVSVGDLAFSSERDQELYEDPLTIFILSMQSLMMRADNPRFDPDDIVRAVTTKRSLTQDVVDSVRKKTIQQVPKRIVQACEYFCHSERLSEVRTEFAAYLAEHGAADKNEG